MIKIWKSGDLIDVPVPSGLQEIVRSHINTASEPVVPKNAATIMLVRDRIPVMEETLGQIEGKAEVFMLRRSKTMSFMPDAMVFPGGGVHADDSNLQVPWIGPTAAEWAMRMHCDEHTARSVVVAAIRELFEECGVLLAGNNENSVVEDLTKPYWQNARMAIQCRELSFTEVLIRENLSIRSDLLGLRSHWVTPEFEPKRYNTYFFAALVPTGQLPDGKSSEASQVDWVVPELLLSRAEQEGVLVLPPTAYNLSLIAQAQDASTFVIEEVMVSQIMLSPIVDEETGEIRLVCRLP